MEIHSLSDQPGSPEFVPIPKVLKFFKMAKLGIYGPLGCAFVLLLLFSFFNTPS